MASPCMITNHWSPPHWRECQIVPSLCLLFPGPVCWLSWLIHHPASFSLIMRPGPASLGPTLMASNLTKTLTAINYSSLGTVTTVCVSSPDKGGTRLRLVITPSQGTCPDMQDMQTVSRGNNQHLTHIISSVSGSSNRAEINLPSQGIRGIRSISHYWFYLIWFMWVTYNFQPWKATPRYCIYWT